MEKIQAIVFFFIAIFYKKCLWLAKLVYWIIYFIVTLLILSVTNVMTFSPKMHIFIMDCTSITQIIAVIIVLLYTVLAFYIDKNASISMELLTSFERKDNISSWKFWKTIFKLKG
ncbi:MAG: hypothetical protein LUG94_03445 [Ruminococcus sp.]|nr:hypothetical protein [Ruminococcus sp.]